MEDIIELKFKVKYEKMTRLEYNEYRGWKLPENENGNDNGYKVVDIESKREFWIPKEEFEIASK